MRPVHAIFARGDKWTPKLLLCGRTSRAVGNCVGFDGLTSITCRTCAARVAAGHDYIRGERDPRDMADEG